MKIAFLFTVVLFIVFISTVSGHADYADVYHWHMRADEFLMNVPGYPATGRRRRDVYLNKWRPRHSVVLFRKKCYEWGPPTWRYHHVSYSDGGIGRTQIYGWKTFIGTSHCTQEQADSLGRWYMRRYPTHRLLFNNSHHYAEWLINKLVNNRCGSYSYP
nr:uncharacterized protein LOC129280575 [Lytechinus pictus]